MKTIVYWVCIGVLLSLEIVALCLFIGMGTRILFVAVLLHVSVALLFAILLGIHRRTLSGALLSVPVITANPLVGLLAMVVIDEKFNRETQERFLEASAMLRSGNPFGTFEGGVEIASNEEIIDPARTNLVQRVASRGGEARLREVEVLAASRRFALIPLMERIAATTSGDGRVLAQAAVQETAERVSVWARNLRTFVEEEEPVPVGMIFLAATAFIEIRRSGRNPQAFGLPGPSVLEDVVERRIREAPEDARCLSLLCQLLLLEERFEEAERHIAQHAGTPGFDVEVERVRVKSARGDWTGLMESVERIGDEPWRRLPTELKEFWKI